MTRILLISEFIAPMQEIAAIRWTKILSYIKQEQEVEITILTTQKDYTNKNKVLPLTLKDPFLVKNMSEYKDYYEVPFGKTYDYLQTIIHKKNRKNTNNYKVKDNNVKNFFIKELNNLKSDFRNYLVIKKVTRYSKKIKFNYDVMISSFGPSWTHIIASKIKKQNPKIMWIADFRDVYAQDTDGKIGYHRHVNYTKKYCKYAEVITCVNAVMDVHECKNQKKIVITNGFDPQEANIPQAPSKFICFFSGRLYESRRNLKAFFKVIKELIDLKIIDKNKVVLAYAGNDFQDFHSQARECHVANLVYNYGFLARDKVLKIQSEAAILLQAAWNTKNEKAEWSGKMYEYIMARKPIVCLIDGDEPYSEPSKFISRVGGVCYEYCRDKETFNVMKDYVKKQYLFWNETGNVYVEWDDNYVNSYAYPNIAKKVWNIIEENIKD